MSRRQLPWDLREKVPKKFNEKQPLYSTKKPVINLGRRIVCRTQSVDTRGGRRSGSPLLRQPAAVAAPSRRVHRAKSLDDRSRHYHIDDCPDLDADIPTRQSEQQQRRSRGRHGVTPKRTLKTIDREISAPQSEKQQRRRSRSHSQANHQSQATQKAVADNGFSKSIEHLAFTNAALMRQFIDLKKTNDEENMSLLRQNAANKRLIAQLIKDCQLKDEQIQHLQNDLRNLRVKNDLAATGKYTYILYIHSS